MGITVIARGQSEEQIFVTIAIDKQPLKLGMAIHEDSQLDASMIDDETLLSLIKERV